MASPEPRLAILVPMQGAIEALDGFVSHISVYFEHDKRDRLLARDIVLVEGALPVGALVNAAVMHVGKWATSLCLHPPFFLPVWADYGPEPSPGMLAEHVYDAGAAPAYGPLLLSPQHFEAADGVPESAVDYPSAILALHARLKGAGIALAQRGGTFAVEKHTTPARAIPSGAGLSARKAQIVSASRKTRPRAITMGGQPDLTPAVIVLKAAPL